MVLILLRHTTPAVKPGICYGQTDLDVVEGFQKEAEAVVESLPEVQHIVTSPLQRCRKLANFIGAAAGRTITEDHRFIEMDFGTWENRAWSDIPRVELDAWAEDFMHARPHGGESVAMLQARTVDALSDWRRDGASTLVVCHAGVIKAALATGSTAAHFDTTIDFGGFVTISDP